MEILCFYRFWRRNVCLAQTQGMDVNRMLLNKDYQKLLNLKKPNNPEVGFASLHYRTCHQRDQIWYLL